MRNLGLIIALLLTVSASTFSQSITRSSINSLGSSVMLESLLVRQSVGQAAVVGILENGVVLKQ